MPAPSPLNDPVATVRDHYPPHIAAAALAAPGLRFGDLPPAIAAEIEPDAATRAEFADASAVTFLASLADHAADCAQRDAAATARKNAILSKPLLTSRDLAEVLGVSRMTLTRYRRAGYVPKPVACDYCLTLWLAADVIAWIRNGCGWAHPELATAAQLQYRRTHGVRVPLDELLGLDVIEAYDPATENNRIMARIADAADGVLNQALSGDFVQPPLNVTREVRIAVANARADRRRRRTPDDSGQ